MSEDIVAGNSVPVTLGVPIWAVMINWHPHSMPALKVIISQFIISSQVFRL
jgi:hypothetical protein